MKKILFVIESLACAGAEKSLITLLNLIDYKHYEVDLQLFSFGGELETLVPKDVHILPPLSYFEECKVPLFKSLKETSWKFFRSRVTYSLKLRTGNFNNKEKAVLLWKACHTCFAPTKEYDVAIAYAQCLPTFYVADCVKAKKKIAWVNAVFQPTGWCKEYNLHMYKTFDHISTVSQQVYNVFRNVFPDISNKCIVIRDMIDGKMINAMAESRSTAASEMNGSHIKLLTVGRLDYLKGYDLAIEAGKILKDKNIDFIWYILGKGELEGNIRNQIEKLGLQDNFQLLGVRTNPYPYFKQANIYVQTSREEGFGLAIAEARILNVPVVTTRFSAVYTQMVEGKNGLVVDIDSEAIANGILSLITNKKLYNDIVEYQKKEDKQYIEEISKIYTIIN